MKVAISTIKQNNVYLFIYAENPEVTKVTREQFKQKVESYALEQYSGRFATSCYVETNDDTYAVIVVLDGNLDQEAPQQQFDI